MEGNARPQGVVGEWRKSRQQQCVVVICLFFKDMMLEKLKPECDQEVKESPHSPHTVLSQHEYEYAFYVSLLHHQGVFLPFNRTPRLFFQVLISL